MHQPDNNNGLFTQLKRAVVLVKEFSKKGTDIASFCPSSPWMARAMVRGIQWDTARCVVELGAGTGPVTNELIKQGGARFRRVILEKSPALYKVLKERFPKEDVVLADAVELPQVLMQRGIRPEEVDHVVSGLPCPSIPEPVMDEIMAGVGRYLAPNGSMHQLTMFPVPLYAGFYRQYFHDVRFRPVFLNLPPGGVYTCSHPKQMEGISAGFATA